MNTKKRDIDEAEETVRELTDRLASKWTIRDPSRLDAKKLLILDRTFRFWAADAFIRFAGLQDKTDLRDCPLLYEKAAKAADQQQDRDLNVWPLVRRELNRLNKRLQQRNQGQDAIQEGSAWH